MQYLPATGAARLGDGKARWRRDWGVGGQSWGAGLLGHTSSRRMDAVKKIDSDSLNYEESLPAYVRCSLYVEKCVSSLTLRRSRTP